MTRQKQELMKIILKLRFKICSLQQQHCRKQHILFINCQPIISRDVLNQLKEPFSTITSSHRKTGVNVVALVNRFKPQV